MGELAEISTGTVRKIGRPFQPGQSGNPGANIEGADPLESDDLTREIAAVAAELLQRREAKAT